MALVAGYCLVVAASISLGYYTASSGTGVKSTSRTTVERAPPRQRSEEDSDSESEQGDVSSLTTLDDCTLVLCVRTDLSMSTGKIAAQCSHATLACYKTLLSKNPVLLRKWARAGYLKSVVRCSDEDALLLLQAQAQSLNLCARSIQDAFVVLCTICIKWDDGLKQRTDPDCRWINHGAGNSGADGFGAASD